MVNDDRHAIVYIGIEWQHLHDLLKVLLQAILLAEQRTVVTSTEDRSMPVRHCRENETS